MLPDVLHFAVALLLVGTLFRLFTYWAASNIPNSPIYKFVAFAY